MTDSQTPTLGKADIEARFAAFEPVKPEPDSPATRERRHRHQRVDKIVERAVSDLRQLGLVFAADAAMSIAALDSLEQVGFQAHAAINTIPDSKLVTPAEARASKPRAPRKPKPEVAPKPETTTETPAAEPETTVEENAPAESIESPEEMDARFKAERAAREAGEPEPVAPDETFEEYAARKKAEREAGAGPRGAEDPNAGDGF